MKSIKTPFCLGLLLLLFAAGAYAQNINWDTTYLYFDYYNNPLKKTDRSWGWYHFDKSQSLSGAYFYYKDDRRYAHHLDYKSERKQVSPKFVKSITLNTLEQLAEIVPHEEWPLVYDFIFYYRKLYIIERTKDNKYYLYKVKRWVYSDGHRL